MKVELPSSIDKRLSFTIALWFKGSMQQPSARLTQLQFIRRTSTVLTVHLVTLLFNLIAIEPVGAFCIVMLAMLLRLSQCQLSVDYLREMIAMKPNDSICHIAPLCEPGKIA